MQELTGLPLYLLCATVLVAAPIPAQEPAGQVGLPGERLPESALGPGVVETLQEMLQRAADVGTGEEQLRQARNGRQGRWIVPSRRATGQPHSGAHHAINEWGDTRMGIGFPRPAHVRGAWIAGQASDGAWARGLRASGFRAGVLVARTDWFEDIAAAPSWWAIDLAGVDRIEIEARAALDGAGWYALDDLTFAWASGEDETITVDFDDLEWRTPLTGSGYAGLTWETGSGPFQAEARAIPPPLVPPGAQVDDDGGALAGPASGPGTLPTLLGDFDGMRMFEPGTSYLPPDTCGAVGPDHFVSVVNVKLGVFDKLSGARLFDIPLETFFGVTGLGDPRVTYDHHAQRWFLLASSGPGTARIYLAISLTGDPAGAWFKTYIEAAQGSDVGRWPDYPTLGFDQDGYFVAALMVPAPMTIWAIDKAPLLAATPALGTVTAWRDLPFEGAIQPCVTYGDSGGELLVSRRTATTLRLRQVTGPLSAPALAELGIVVVPLHGNPPAAPALGSATALGSGDTRPMNAVYRDGSVYTAHTIGLDGRAAGRWYEVDVASRSAVQVGTIADPVRHYFYPSIAVNAAGHVLLACSGSHAGEYAGAYYSGHHALDPAGATAPAALLQPGLGPYQYLDGNGTNRWGDYSLSSVDPLDDTTFWTIQEYARTNNRWGTRIAEAAFVAPCPSTWSTCFTSPNSVGQGARISSLGGTSLADNDLTLMVTGAPANQNGIFFYGPQESASILGNGLLCVGGSINRLPLVTSDLFGFASHDLDVDDPPLPSGQITAGSTWYFQLWYRDPAGGGAAFNLSDALGATFCP